MALGYSTGPITFRAKEDILANMLVQIVSGSTTTPPEVEIADSVMVVGVARESAETGELVTVAPFNMDGSLDILTSGADITAGALLYSDDSGHVTMASTSGTQVGVAKAACPVPGFCTVIGLTTPDIISSEIAIEDAGDFYTTDNVEAALQELGPLLAPQATRTVFLPMDLARRTTDSFGRLDPADGAGVLGVNGAPALEDIELEIDGHWVPNAVPYPGSALGETSNFQLAFPLPPDAVTITSLGMTYTTQSADLAYSVDTIWSGVLSSGAEFSESTAIYTTQTALNSYETIVLHTPTEAGNFNFISVAIFNPTADANPLGIVGLEVTYTVE